MKEDTKNSVYMGMKQANILPTEATFVALLHLVSSTSQTAAVLKIFEEIKSVMKPTSRLLSTIATELMKGGLAPYCNEINL